PPCHEAARLLLQFHSRRTRARWQSRREYARRTESRFSCASEYHARVSHKSALLRTSPTASLNIIAQFTETVSVLMRVFSYFGVGCSTFGARSRILLELGVSAVAAERNEFSWNASY